MFQQGPQPSSSLRLSILDQAPIPAGYGGAQALQNAVALAQRAEALGYHRYWVAEHHGTPSLACASPEVLVAAIAAATQQIRVGSGGVMLPHYSPFKVAETFSMLAGLYPHRIDLGIGRASGSDTATALALQRIRGQGMVDDFPQQLAELLAYYDWGQPAHAAQSPGADVLPQAFARLPGVLPGRPEQPYPWLLGSSPQSSIWAAQLGLPYVFADFINAQGAASCRHYRNNFRAAPQQAQPYVGVALWAICADTEAQAIRLGLPAAMMLHYLQRGQLVPVPTEEEAETFFREQGIEGAAIGAGRRRIIGTPEQVRAGIEAVAAEYGADEVMLVSITNDQAGRHRSYGLIAEAFGLKQS